LELRSVRIALLARVTASANCASRCARAPTGASGALPGGVGLQHTRAVVST
jgi:hypothetical protein